MSTFELRKLIVSLLKTKCSRVFFQRAPVDTEFPYLVYDTPSDGSTSPGKEIELEIDVWDNISDTKRIEDLADSIDGNDDAFNPTGLSNLTINGVSFYKEMRYSVPDEDKTISRRQIKFTIKVY